jgi:hypothetical protein
LSKIHFMRSVMIVAMSRGLALVAVVALASTVRAQRVTHTAVIDPGMTRDQVVVHLGDPDGESHAGSFTYLFYDNGCAQTCGMDDVVVLERNIVTDAIFRSPKRTYTGASSSPQALPPIPTGRFLPEPIHASTPDDVAHRGGIVFMGPRPPARPPQFTRIVPNRADSGRLRSSGHEEDTVGTSAGGGNAPAGRADSSSPPPHEE